MIFSDKLQQINSENHNDAPRIPSLEEQSRKWNRNIRELKINDILESIPKSDKKISYASSTLLQRCNSHDGSSSTSDDPIPEYHKRNHYTVTGITKCNTEPIHSILKNRNRFKVQKAQSGEMISEEENTSEELEIQIGPTRRKFDESLYWIAMHRKKFGFRYIALCLLAVIYTLFGAVTFYLIEGTHEKQTTCLSALSARYLHQDLQMLDVHVENLDKLLHRLAELLSETVNNPNKTTSHERMKELLRESYIELQKQEAQYKWSTYYKLEDPENNMKWTFSSAFFFSMNVYTTTGYGVISAETKAGQIFTIFYAFCFVPMTLVILRDLGQLFLVNFTKLYAHSLTFARKLKGYKDIDDNEMIQLPIKFCMAILAVYLMFCTTFVYIYDALMGNSWEQGISYFTAFYFSFISLTTIGLGDVMPNNVTYAPVISILFFIGMAVTKVVNRSTYITVENGVFGCMTLVENKIDNLFSRNRKLEKNENSVGEINTDSEEEFCPRDEMMNNFTVRSITTFMTSNADIYGGGFGRITMRRGDLINPKYHNNHHTVAASHGLRAIRSISLNISKKESVP